MRSRGVKLLDLSTLLGLPTKRLLGLRDRLLRLEETSTQSDLEPGELKAGTLYFKDDPRWRTLPAAVVAQLSSREHLPKGADRLRARAKQTPRNRR